MTKETPDEMEGMLVIPYDPDIEDDIPIMEMIALCSSQGICDLLCRDLKALGFRYVILPINPYKTLCELDEYRELWKKYITHKTINNIINK